MESKSNSGGRFLTRLGHRLSERGTSAKWPRLLGVKREIGVSTAGQGTRFIYANCLTCMQIGFMYANGLTA